MSKFVKMISDIACCVGCCVGVGFLSGKEADVFFGNYFNVAIFAVTFAAVTFALREFCRQTRSATVEKMSLCLLGKRSLWGSAAVAFCSFVCIVTSLAGAQQFLGATLTVKLPLFAVAIAACSALLLGKLRLIKLFNVISVITAMALVLFCPMQGVVPIDHSVTFCKPICYALFSATVSLGLTGKLAADCSRRENALSAIISSALIALLMCAILPKRGLSLTLSESGWGIFAAVTLLLAAVTGVVANAIPVLELIEDVVGDRAVSCMLIFGAALALSMLGLDFAVKTGYTAVAALGGLTVILVARWLWKKGDKKSPKIKGTRQRTHG